MASRRKRQGLLLLAPMVAACHFSMSAGGPDYTKLENAITDELNKSYAAIDRKVSSVDCPRQSSLKIR